MRLKTYFIVTFGCQMNRIESGNYNQIFQNAGLKPTKKLEAADIVLVNSCSVRQSAEDRVYGLGIKLKNITPKPIIILTGCMVGSATGERTRFNLDYLKKKASFVDYFVDKDKLPSFLEKLLKVEGCIPTDLVPTCCNLGRMEGYGVPIMTGCNNFCSYCVVPYARGREIYHPQEEIIKNVQNLIKDGHTKIILLGQNVNSYPNFPQLLKKVHDLPGLEEVGFMTANPWNFPDKLIDALTLPRVSKYLHLPVQSGNDEILVKMGRAYTLNQYFNLVKRIREKTPGIELGTDIIVGFPGETEKQFQDTLNLCKQVGFGQIYVSKYSPRVGTKAMGYENNVTLEEKKRRYKQVMSCRLQTSKEKT